MKQTLAIWYWLTWIAFGLLVKLPLWAIGQLVVPLALGIFGLERDSLRDKWRTDHWPKLIWLWGNDEDGVPDWWMENAPSRSWLVRTFPRYWWLANRNSANNFRYLIREPDDVKTFANFDEHAYDMKSTELDTIDMPLMTRWRWSGWLASYRRLWLNHDGSEYSEFYVGFKLGSPVPGVGFTFQPRFGRKIGR